MSRFQSGLSAVFYRARFYLMIRYASLFFIAGIDLDDNELISLEIIHRYVEVLDKWFMNVCELDIIFNFPQAYAILGGAFIYSFSR